MMVHYFMLEIEQAARVGVRGGSDLFDKSADSGGYVSDF